jgi:hypothetical protein
MSLINDALKRARQAQQGKPPPGTPPLQPVESTSGTVVGRILPAVIIFLLVAACFFLWLALARRSVTKIAPEPGILVTQPAASIPIPASNAPPVFKANPPGTNAPATNTAALPPPSPPPEPKLQGIVYTPAQPWAIVDGKTVHVGDRLGEFRVKEISPRNVTLEKADGSQKKLGLDK